MQTVLRLDCSSVKYIKTKPPQTSEGKRQFTAVLFQESVPDSLDNHGFSGGRSLGRRSLSRLGAFCRRTGFGAVLMFLVTHFAGGLVRAFVRFVTTASGKGHDRPRRQQCKHYFFHFQFLLFWNFTCGTVTAPIK